MCVGVCVCVHMSACLIRVCKHSDVYVCMQARVCAFTFAGLYVCVYLPDLGPGSLAFCVEGA